MLMSEIRSSKAECAYESTWCTEATALWRWASNVVQIHKSETVSIPWISREGNDWRDLLDPLLIISWLCHAYTNDVCRLSRVYCASRMVLGVYGNAKVLTPPTITILPIVIVSQWSLWPKSWYCIWQCKVLNASPADLESGSLLTWVVPKSPWANKMTVALLWGVRSFELSNFTPRPDMQRGALEKMPMKPIHKKEEWSMRRGRKKKSQKE